MKQLKFSSVGAGFIIIAVILLIGFSPINLRAAVSPNVNLSKLTGYQGEATIAVDPSNPNRMFAASNTSGSSLFAAYSTDGGATWQYRDADKTIADGAAGETLPRACCDASAVFDKFGNLYLTYLTDNPINVVVAYSTDGGHTFGGLARGDGESQILGMFPLEPNDFRVPHRRILPEKESEFEAPETLNIGGDQPTVAVGPSFYAGEVSLWVSWDNGPKINVAGTRVTGLGAFTPFSNTPIDTGLTGQFGDIEVGPNGQVIVTAQTNTSISISLDSDGLGPANFTPMSEIPIRQKEFYKPDETDFLASVFVSNTNVDTFDKIPAQPNRSVDAEADLAWDRSGGLRNGRVYLAYTDETVNENNDMDIRLRYSDNNGASWSSFVRVNDDSAAVIRSQFFPRIEVDQTTGYLAAAFYDCRNDALGTDNTPNTEAQVFGAVSFNGGASFATNELISQGSSRSPSFGNGNEYGDYNGLSFYNNKYFYIWSDNSNSTADNPNGTRAAPDIYTAKVTVAGPTAASVTVAGRVSTDDGRGLTNAIVTLTDATGETRTARTTAFGYYRFDDVGAGQTYIVAINSKRFVFTPQVVTITENINNLNFTAQ